VSSSTTRIRVAAASPSRVSVILTVRLPLYFLHSIDIASNRHTGIAQTVSEADEEDEDDE